ncbi:MAG: hypothetical protein F4160_00950 [Rhodospirillaceae bacterium]|nr:hypothetical protein [Rhodospirillaceae bacterium]MYH35350.1 hypothetical protein [Rhodospirillaceae bacterium]MYK15579.1 hypothetical protein [Rhodospirillaceae bacterium]
MKASFDAAEFVRDIGHDLVRDFEKARKATTPGLIGGAMERSVKNRLMQILPHGIGVGSGCVIDTFGGTSRQMDIVLYETEQCPVFCVNETPETTYYPCEGVLAVGEIKSAIGKKELGDSFEKIRSVKSLRRAFQRTKSGRHVGRSYGEYGSATAYGFDLSRTNKGDVFGFVLAEKPSIQLVPLKGSASSITGHYHENVKTIRNDVLCPDMTVFLDGNVLTAWTVDTGNRNSSSAPYIPARAQAVLPHSIVPTECESPFGELLKAIWQRHQDGLTAHLPLQQYLHYQSKKKAHPTWAIIVNVDAQTVTGSIRTPTEHLGDKIELLGREIV